MKTRVIQVLGFAWLLAAAPVLPAAESPRALASEIGRGLMACDEAAVLKCFRGSTGELAVVRALLAVQKAGADWEQAMRAVRGERAWKAMLNGGTTDPVLTLGLSKRVTADRLNGFEAGASIVEASGEATFIMPDDGTPLRMFQEKGSWYADAGSLTSLEGSATSVAGEWYAAADAMVAAREALQPREAAKPVAPASKKPPAVKPPVPARINPPPVTKTDIAPKASPTPGPKPKVAPVRAVAVDIAGVPRQFARLKHRELARLAGASSAAIPPAMESFFAVAGTGDWVAVSNSFAGTVAELGGVNAARQTGGSLWVPMHETFATFEQWALWKSDTNELGRYAAGILDRLPEGSIYWGGTDSGRFVLTAVQACRGRPRVVVLTQNALVDPHYMACMRQRYGSTLDFPDDGAVEQAMRDYAAQVEAGDSSGHVTVEQGLPQAYDVEGVMELNGVVAKCIFERNRATHECFVEESYVIGWMYPHLVPAGLIMKLNPGPVAALAPDVVAADSAMWDGVTERFRNAPGPTNAVVRQAYAKMRVAQAGLFEQRGMIPEATTAYRQAIDIAPDCVEVLLRYADMCSRYGLRKRARQLAGRALTLDPGNPQATALSAGE